MLTLPHDVWLHIAHFIPPLLVQNLIGLNSTFFDLAMDYRYRQMSFAYLDNKMLRNLSRLKDPAVAKRVRVLHVYPGFLKQLRESNNTTTTHHHRPLRTRLTDLATAFVFPKPRKYRPFKFRTPEQVVQEMLDVFYHLPNVTDYHIMWSGLQPIPNSSPVPLLAALLHGPALRTLSLEISLENIQSLLTPARHMRNLEELTLTLRLDHSCTASSHAHILTHHLAPTISALHPSLRKLTIQSCEAQDLAPLFHALAFLPHLHHLTLAIPIQPPHLGAPPAIAAFLHRQRTSLHSLALRTTHYSGPGLIPDPSASSLDAWINTALTHVALPALRTLDLSSPLLPPAAALACLRQFARGIKWLGVTGRHQAYDDVREVVRAFEGVGVGGVGGLETLRLGSVSLTPDLVDLLAREMPGLDRLELLVRDLGPSAAAQVGGGVPLPLDVDVHMDMDMGMGMEMDEEGGVCHCVPVEDRPDSTLYITDNTELFFAEMESRVYNKWRLRRLKVVVSPLMYQYYSGPELHHHLGQLFSGCVPALRWFG